MPPFSWCEADLHLLLGSWEIQLNFIWNLPPFSQNCEQSDPRVCGKHLFSSIVLLNPITDKANIGKLPLFLLILLVPQKTSLNELIFYIYTLVMTCWHGYVWDKCVVGVTKHEISWKLEPSCSSLAWYNICYKYDSSIP